MACDIPEIDENKLAEMARTCACFNFRKASRSVTQLFDQILAPTGLRSTQLVILITGQLLGPSSIARLARELVMDRSTQLVILITGQLLGPTSIARLARELVMDRSTLTRNLKPLINMGLVCFTQGENGKQKSVEVTADGQAALLRSEPYWEQAQTHLVARFGTEAWERIMQDLSAIVDATRSNAV